MEEIAVPCHPNAITPRENHGLRYKEEGATYEQVPRWVTAMVKLGYTWERERRPWRRRIGIVSMPCGSPAAALIALGAFRKDLERGNANDLCGHFDGLRRAMDAYVNDPENHSPILVNSLVPKKKWKFHEYRGDCIAVVDAKYKPTIRRKGRIEPNQNGPCVNYITGRNASDWHIQGQAVVQSLESVMGLSEEDYKIFPSWTGQILPDNLRRSYSGLLLFGDGEGRDTHYMRSIYGVSFLHQGRELEVGRLLTLHPPSGSISRISFLNHITLEQPTSDPYLVIANGVSAFVKACKLFKNSDILCVYARDESVEKISILRDHASQLSRYYAVKEWVPQNADLPRGIELSKREALR